MREELSTTYKSWNAAILPVPCNSITYWTSMKCEHREPKKGFQDSLTLT